ncbi:MAG: GGDEF domain-containing protein [Clostridiaceae bacterium]|nr:GGDEF domain-containing protein [Eubacteriales bacterium]
MLVKLKQQGYKWAAALLAAVLFAFCAPVSARAESSLTLTPEEEAYIAESGIVRVVTVDGAAPIMYRTADGVPQGIALLVVDEIAKMTGLRFEYEIRDSVAEALVSGCDIFLGLPPHYAPEGMALSDPFLKSETILYINASVDSDRLDDKRFAAVRGSDLPEGVRAENATYYDTREASLDAVNRGEADYGYGNSYSVAFYTLRKGYKNLISIPLEKESREYCIGFFEKNELLFSILNKAIGAIGDEQMQRLILDATMYADRKLNLSMLMDAYGVEIVAVFTVILAGLAIGTASYVRMNKRLKLMNKRLEMQNVRYEHLAALSNEYLYEYFLDADRLETSGKCARILAPEALDALKAMLARVRDDGHSSAVTLPLSGGKTGVFRTVHSFVYGDGGKPYSVIGKLVDISRETAEKEKLILESRTDGLTGLNNAMAAKELIAKELEERAADGKAALLFIDFDDFKHINDTFGHLAGDQVLSSFGESLRRTFRNTDIIGRMGGDEFAVYLKDVPSADFIRERCRRLRELIQKKAGDTPVSVSIGIAFAGDGATYDRVFQMADDALYHAKRKGKDQEVIYGEA